jgi:hypothetical protein
VAGEVLVEAPLVDESLVSALEQVVLRGERLVGSVNPEVVREYQYCCCKAQPAVVREMVVDEGVYGAAFRVVQGGPGP